MRTTRTNEEHLIDQLLMLKLLDAMEQHSRRPDRFQEVMKVMKAAWEAALDTFDRSIKALNMVFYRAKDGPCSRHVYYVRDSLVAAGLIEEQHIWSGWSRPPAYRLTEKGRAVLAGCEELFSSPTNREIRRILEQVGQNVGPLTSAQAWRRSHRSRGPDLRGFGESTTVEDFPLNHNMLLVLDEADVRASFELDEDWYDTLEILFSPDYDPDAVPKASSKSFEELFVGV